MILSKVEDIVEPDDPLIGPIRTRLMRVREAEGPGSMAPERSVDPIVTAL